MMRAAQQRPKGSTTGCIESTAFQDCPPMASMTFGEIKCFLAKGRAPARVDVRSK